MFLLLQKRVCGRNRVCRVGLIGIIYDWKYHVKLPLTFSFIISQETETNKPLGNELLPQRSLTMFSYTDAGCQMTPQKWQAQ